MSLKAAKFPPQPTHMTPRGVNIPQISNIRTAFISNDIGHGHSSYMIRPLATEGGGGISNNIPGYVNN